MRNFNRTLYVFLSMVLSLFSLLQIDTAKAVGTNLLSNYSVESNSGGNPSSWSTNSWGTNNPSFSYQSTAHTGSRSLSTVITNLSSGDAKWMPDQVAVTAGQSYTYSDYSKASVATELDLAYVDSSGAMSFEYLATISASNTWQQNTAIFTVPAGKVSVAVYHIIYSVGSLQTDDFSLTALDTPSSNNLLLNSSFETPNGSNPEGWYRGSWGSNSPTFTHINGDSHTGTRSARVEMNNAVSGDAKWHSAPVNVAAGSTYLYEDYYKSGVTTRVVVALYDVGGTASYLELTSAPASPSWSLYSASFAVLSGVNTAVVYHLLDSQGVLTVDDVYLSATIITPPSSGLIPNSSLENVNGPAPEGWQTGGWGTNSVLFDYVAGDAHDGTRSAKVTISNYTSGDAKWFFSPLQNLTPGAHYNLSAWYKTNSQPKVVAMYTDNTGSQRYISLATPLTSSTADTTWTQYNTVLSVPVDATSITVYFLLASNGWLQVDDYHLSLHTIVGFGEPIISITFDDALASIHTNGLPVLQKYGLVSTQYIVSGRLNTPNYMTTSMVQDFATSGNEIASHTVSHPDLTQLGNGALTTELSSSQSVLRQNFGPNVAKNFASPYGAYSSTTINSIKQYYKSHRSTDVGFNTSDNFDPYNIVVQNVKSDTTTAQVSAWVSQAVAENSWLVLVYHSVSNPPYPDDYTVSIANLDAELLSIKNSGARVLTIDQAIDWIAIL